MERKSFMHKMVVMLFALAGMYAAEGQSDRVYKSLDEVADPSEVYVLRLRNKRLRTVPSAVYGMANLRELDLRGNQISWLSDSIAQLRHLRRLEVSHNPLMGLPEGMTQMKELEELVVWDTYVTDVPPAFEALDSTLKVIDLRSCPLLPADQEKIAHMLPSVEKLWDKACNCGD